MDIGSMNIVSTARIVCCSSNYSVAYYCLAEVADLTHTLDCTSILTNATSATLTRSATPVATVTIVTTVPSRCPPVVRHVALALLHYYTTTVLL